MYARQRKPPARPEIYLRWSMQARAARSSRARQRLATRLTTFAWGHNVYEAIPFFALDFVLLRLFFCAVRALGYHIAAGTAGLYPQSGTGLAQRASRRTGRTADLLLLDGHQLHSGATLAFWSGGGLAGPLHTFFWRLRATISRLYSGHRERGHPANVHATSAERGVQLRGRHGGYLRLGQRSIEFAFLVHGQPDQRQQLSNDAHQRSDFRGRDASLIAAEWDAGDRPFG